MWKRGGRISPSVRRALFIVPIWLVASYWMWSWWLTSDRVNYLPLFILLSLAMFYEFLVLPTTFLYFVIKSKVPRKRIAKKGDKVAVISLCVPSSESLDIVEKQLKAMSEIEYPHDSWILDEGNNKTIAKLAKKYGVKHFSRKGVAKYNQDTPPFKSKTKAGNVNAWLEHVKRRKYDYFVQFDIDHLAVPKYLDKTLGHFRDPEVAWVQAPSVYKNLSHWTARGAAEQELVLQGPLQMGFYGFSETPFIIGSHCTYRMSAIREIGGFQPTRAEDHLDTVMLSNRGYKGVFVPEVIAEGDGPETLNTYLAQQYAWAFSMFQVLLFHSPKLLKGMSLKRKLQFLFAQTWYPLWSLSYLTMFMSPVFALIIGKDIAQVQGNDFALHFLPIFCFSFAIWWTARPIMHPKNVGISWRGMILHVVRWPIVLRAIIAATFRLKKPYMITPKGDFAKIAPKVETYRIFLLFGVISALAIIYSSAVHGIQSPQGQILFATLNALLMAFVCLTDLNISLRNAKIGFRYTPKNWLKPVGATGFLLFITAFALLSAPVTTKATLRIAQNQSTAQPVASGMTLIDDMNYDERIDFIKKFSGRNQENVSVGLYNPINEKSVASQPYIKHVFADWKDINYISKQVAINAIDNKTLLITLEPNIENIEGEQLLKNIRTGTYDSILKNICQITRSSSKKIYIRFGHEMELKDLYQWGNQDPDEYIRAFQHTVSYFRSNGSGNIKWVWSPAGNNGAEVYYPGDKYVDVIGTTILYDQYWYGSRYVSFEELASKRIWQKYYFLDKPLWIVEYGVGNADKNLQKKIINEAITTYKDYGFQAIIYLNIEDSNIDGPDYRINNDRILSRVLGILPTQRKSKTLKDVDSTINNQNEIISNTQNNNTIFESMKSINVKR